MAIKRYLEFLLEKRVYSEMPLPKDVLDIAAAYDKAGKEIFLVGGAVRDFLQGKQPKDFDLVTNALPEESKAILKGFSVSDEQGKKFGVIRVYTKSEPEGYEIASYRKDISKGRDTKGDAQKVEMGEHITIEDDCRRRDLTMNALFYDIKRKEIVDLVGGIEDIKNGVVRAVGNPAERFAEDRLRICRIFRFAARTGSEIDADTAKAIKADCRLRGVGDADDVSQERIWEEFKKAWSQSKSFSDYLGMLERFDMWPQVFPGVKISGPVESKDFAVVMASLFADNDPDELERKLVRDFRIESDLAKQLVFLIRLADLSADNAFDMYKKKVASGIKDSTILEWMRATGNRSGLALKFVGYVPTTSSKELMDKGFRGRELGEEIKRIETEKIKQMLWPK